MRGTYGNGSACAGACVCTFARVRLRVWALCVHVRPRVCSVYIRIYFPVSGVVSQIVLLRQRAAVKMAARRRSYPPNDMPFTNVRE